jgi:hypothetical protein
MKKIVGIFVCMLLVATALSVAGTEEQEALFADVAPEKGVIPAGAGDFPILNEFPITGDAYCVGLGFDGTNFWVSAGDQGTGQCTFYLFDEDGTLVDSAQQGGGASGWGHRDLAWDGTYMFGSYDPLIDGFMDIATYSGNFVGPISPNRAMAYDGTYFYTCGFGEMLYQLDWDGNWGSTATATALSGPWSGCYGLAYDEVYDCLWMTTADYTGTINKLDMDGNLLDTYTTLPEYDIQGGCTMAQTSYGYVLAVLQQSDPDTVTFYEVHAAEEPELEIGEISGGFGITSSVKNTGEGEATDVDWSITLDGGLIILGKETTGNFPTIAAGGEEEIKTGLVFGIGKPTITVYAECAEGKTADANATGFVLLFFVLNVA